jgi:dihydrofolate reductase
MKTIIFQMSVSLDGYIEGPNHEIDWHIVDDDFNAYAVETLQATETLIMGRTTYELMAGYWPTASDDDAAVRDQMNGTPKLVFSRTLKSVTWQNSRLATGSIADEMARLKQAPGDGLLWVGGSALAASFLELGLIDEIRVILTPILLSGGTTMFGNIKRRHGLSLVSARSFNSGNVLLTYRPVPR